MINLQIAYKCTHTNKLYILCVRVPIRKLTRMIVYLLPPSNIDSLFPDVEILLIATEIGTMGHRTTINADSYQPTI